MRRHLLIVGAGISGLSSALFAARRGEQVTLVEQRPEPMAASYTDSRSIDLTLSGRAQAILKQLEVLEETLANAVTVSGRQLHLASGSTLYQPYGTETPLITISRFDLIRILTEKAKTEENIRLCYETEVLDIDREAPSLQVRGKEGQRTLTADLILAADGVYSKVRHFMHKGLFANLERKYFPWRYRQFRLRADLSHPHRIHLWPREHAFLIAIPDKEGSYNCNLFLDPTLTCPNFSAYLAEQFPDLQASIPSILDQIAQKPESGIVRISTSPWAYKDKVALVGDSAHGVYHFLAQGANAALESCSQLDRALRENSNVEQALRRYQEIRLPSVTALSQLSENHFFTLKNQSSTSWFHSRLVLEQWLGLKSQYSLITDAGIPYEEAESRIRKRNLALNLVGIWMAQAVLSIGIWLRLKRGVS